MKLKEIALLQAQEVREEMEEKLGEKFMVVSSEVLLLKQSSTEDLLFRIEMIDENEEKITKNFSLAELEETDVNMVKTQLAAYVGNYVYISAITKADAPDTWYILKIIPSGYSKEIRELYSGENDVIEILEEEYSSIPDEVKHELHSLKDELNNIKLKHICNVMTGKPTQTGILTAYIAMTKMIPDEDIEKLKENICYWIRSRGSARESRETCINYLKDYYFVLPPAEVAEVDSFMSFINERIIGQSMLKSKIKAIYSEYVKSITKESRSKPISIVISGAIGCGKTYIASVIAEAFSRFCSIPTEILDVTDCGSDTETLCGTSKIYNNASVGDISEKLRGLKYGILLIKGIGNSASKTQRIIRRLISGDFENNLLLTRLNYGKTLFIGEIGDTDELISRFNDAASYTLHIEEYTDEEIVHIGKNHLKEVLRNEAASVTIEDKAVLKVYRSYCFKHDIKSFLLKLEFLTNKICFDYKIQKTKISERNLKRVLFPEKKELLREAYSYEELENKFLYFQNELSSEEVLRVNQLRNIYRINLNEEDKQYALSSMKLIINSICPEVKKHDIHMLEEKFDATHYSLYRVKYALLRKVCAANYKNEMIRPILLVTPPGCGKTSIARSMASALGLSFVKIPMSSICSDVLFGLSRNYKSSDPGLIQKAISQSRGKGVIILLDELDKAPNAVINSLYELLDTEKASYYNNYLECNISTKKIMFIATSNDISGISNPLLDRFEVVSFEGYSPKEKITMTKEYIIPKFNKQYNLKISFSDDVIETLVYACPESGIRDIERTIENIAEEILRLDERADTKITMNTLSKYYKIPAMRQVHTQGCKKGSVHALGVGINGGVVFEVQAVCVPNLTEDIVNGLVGESAKESVIIAKTAISNLVNYPIPHIHILLGAGEASMHKDGPSAGAAISIALYSAVSGVKIRQDIAITGEVDLHGDITAVGGLKEKIFAAKRGGIQLVFIPKDSYNDELKSFDIDIVPVSNLNDIINYLRVGT